MKNKIFAFLICGTVLAAGCKSKNKQEASTEDSEQSTTAASPEASSSSQPQNEPKAYTLAFSPDSASLGKQKELSVKLIPGTATELSDPDGKSSGIELTFKFMATNKNKIGGSSVYASTSDYRLVLDNNTSISQSSGASVSVDPESSKESDPITFRLPAGTKPKTLNLFYDETRSSVSMTLTEK